MSAHLLHCANYSWSDPLVGLLGRVDWEVIKPERRPSSLFETGSGQQPPMQASVDEGLELPMKVLITFHVLQSDSICHLADVHEPVKERAEVIRAIERYHSPLSISMSSGLDSMKNVTNNKKI